MSPLFSSSHFQQLLLFLVCHLKDSRGDDTLLQRLLVSIQGTAVGAEGGQRGRSLLKRPARVDVKSPGRANMSSQRNDLRSHSPSLINISNVTFRGHRTSPTRTLFRHLDPHPANVPVARSVEMFDHLHSHFFSFTSSPAASRHKLNLRFKKEEESIIDYSLG